MYNLSPELQKLARACATRRDENRIPDIGLYFGAGQHYRFASDVPVFVIITPQFHRTYKGAK